MSAYQDAAAAVEAVRHSLAADDPFTIAFIDAHLPPGLDGVRVTREILALDPELTVVLLTEGSVEGLNDLAGQLGATSTVLYARRPLAACEIRQFAEVICARRQEAADSQRAQTRLERLLARQKEELQQVTDQLLRDLAGLTMAEADLREREECTRGLLEHIPGVSIQGYDEDGTIRYWNRACADIFGYPAAEALGRHIDHLGLPEEVMESHREALRLGTGATHSGALMPAYEGTVRRVDGHATDVYTIHTVVVAPGNNAQVFRIDLDLTERRRAEEALRRSEKLAAVGTLAAGVAHNFNNLLAVIMGHAQLALREPPGTVQTKRFTSIEQACRRGAELVRGLHTYAAGGSTATSPFDLRDLVAEVLHFSRPLWKDEPDRKGLPLVLLHDLQPTGQVRASESELADGLLCLLTNAVQAMPEGGTLTIRTWAEGTQACLSVSDTGIGMSPGTQARIFTPFFTTKGPRSHGLGLAALHGLLSRLDGTIDVDSREGAGATFVVRIPCMTAPDTLQGDDTGALAEASQQQSVVLVVDDDLEVGVVLSGMIQALGHKACSATSGQQALSLLATHKVDLVITDLGMPEMNGWDLAALIAKHYPDTPVVLLTGWGVEFSADQTEPSGVCGVLRKPLRLDALREALAGHITAPVVRQEG
ncbi:response regulator [bacterium]|nr:response regulator [bacterium]